MVSCASSTSSHLICICCLAILNKLRQKSIPPVPLPLDVQNDDVVSQKFRNSATVSEYEMPLGRFMQVWRSYNS